MKITIAGGTLTTEQVSAIHSDIESMANKMNIQTSIYFTDTHILCVSKGELMDIDDLYDEVTSPEGIEEFDQMQMNNEILDCVEVSKQAVLAPASLNQK